MAVVVKDRVCRQCGAVFQGGPRAWNQAHKDTYYPAKNAKRNAERAANPEPVREKERAYRKKRLESKKS